MDNNSGILEDIKTIKKVMEESSRFISLSGLSGIFTGLTALLGVAAAVLFLFRGEVLLKPGFFTGVTSSEIYTLKIRLLALALIVLILAIGISIYLSYKKSLKKGLRIWTPVSKRFLLSILIPLITGGIIILYLYFGSFWQFVIPSMLVFYGLALANAGKFSYDEVFYLGISEIITGLISGLFPAYGLIFWCFGFGLLNLLYGLVMFRKYER